MKGEILLTGAGGQLGWDVQRRSTVHGVAVHGVAHAELDITDADAVSRVIDERRPRVVVNAASYTAVDKAESDALRAYAANADGPRNLARACFNAGIPLIHVSTDYVFDGTKAGPYTEDDPTGPLSVYGASKLAGEHAIADSGVRHIILRTAWMYGLHGQNFVKTMLRIGREREVLRVVDDQHGCPTYAGDFADAVITLAKRLVEAPVFDHHLGVFHCSGSGEATWCAFARRIFELAGPRLARIPRVEAISSAEFPTTVRRPSNSVLDCSRLARVHGIALRSWPDALAEMLETALAQAA
jgi:dTDP-4-dehydrorhamnose reductase